MATPRSVRARRAGTCEAAGARASERIVCCRSQSVKCVMCNGLGKAEAHDDNVPGSRFMAFGGI